MKVSQGLVELIFIVAMMLTGLPLFVLVFKFCALDKFNYLDDKTVYTMSDTVEMVYDNKGRLVPINLAPIGIDFGGAQLLSIVQDDNCPTESSRIIYQYDANEINPVLSGHELFITKGWKSKRYDKFLQVVNNSGTPTMISSYGKVPAYLIWSYENDCWIVTTKFINIYE